jgi:hypothetical protein
MLEASKLFSENFYLTQYPEVARSIAAGNFANGLDHFFNFGQFEGRNPSPLFDEKFYLAQNPDAAKAVTDGKFSSGFDHFIKFGQFENRNPNFLFDSTFYLTQNPDVGAASARDELTGIEHFVEFGIDEGRASSKYFDISYYLEQNDDLISAGLNNQQALEHFVNFGVKEARDTVEKQGVVAVLLRGGNETAERGFSGSQPGLDILNAALKNRFTGDRNVPFESRIFRDFELNEALNYIESFSEPRNIILIGYSSGGATINELAPKLLPQNIGLAIQIDTLPRPSLEEPIPLRRIVELFGSNLPPGSPNFGSEVPEFVDFLTLAQLTASPNPENDLQAALTGVAFFTGLAQAGLIKLVDVNSLPKNVVRGINYYQTPTNSPDIQGLPNIQKSQNINVETLFNDGAITHSTIDEYKPLHEKIISEIAFAIDVFSQSQTT